MAISEIDDIFSGKISKQPSKSARAKEKSKAVVEPSPPTSTSTSKKRSKKRKRQQHEDVADTDPSRVQSTEHDNTRNDLSHVEDGERKGKAKRTRVVETVRDPSTAIAQPSPTNPPKLKPTAKTKSSKNDKMDDTLQRFKDSRGSGPRKRTDEGFLVYKEDELGIRNEGGDTPLCPFDCTCCF